MSALTDSDLVCIWRQAWDAASDEAMGEILRRFVNLVDAQRSPATPPDLPAIEPDCMTCGTTCSVEDIPRCGTPGHGWTPREKLPETVKGCGSCFHFATPHYEVPCAGCYDPETQACTHKNHQPAQEPTA
jgi:hypothetical protein